MSPVRACPGEQDFKELIAHNLSPEEMEPLLTHLEECPACVRTIEALLGSTIDTLAEAMRHAPTESEAEDAAVDRLIQRPGKVTRYSAPLTGDAATEGRLHPAVAAVLAALAPPQGVPVQLAQALTEQLALL